MTGKKPERMVAALLSILLSTVTHDATSATEPEKAAQDISTQGHTSPQTVQPAFRETVLNSNYEPPEFRNDKKSWPALIYPAQEAFADRGGYVLLNMMIDTKGTPYEISVVDSIGGPALEKSALEWAKKIKMDPARLNNTPVEAGTRLKVRFQERSKGAAPNFVRDFKEIKKAIDSGDRTTADALLKNLKVQNLYEDAYFGLIQFSYAGHWGSEQEKLNALRRAIAYENSEQFLPEEAFQFALTALFDLEIRTQDLGSALLTYKNMSKARQQQPEIQQKMAAIVALRSDDSTYSTRSEISKRSSWFHRLFKRRFSVLVTDGSIAEIKLRCERKYILLPYHDDNEYTLPADYGECDMELVGTPGTEFTLIQS